MATASIIKEQQGLLQQAEYGKYCLTQ